MKKWETELQTLRESNARLTTALQESAASIEHWKKQFSACKEENDQLRSKVAERTHRRAVSSSLLLPPLLFLLGFCCFIFDFIFEREVDGERGLRQPLPSAHSGQGSSKGRGSAGGLVLPHHVKLPAS